MKTLYLTIVVFVLASFSVKAELSAETEMWLQRLDSVIQQRQVFDAMKSEKLSEMYKKKMSLRSPYELISFNTQMYDEYKVFDSDSAMSCVEQNLRLAQQLDNKSLIVEWRIKQAFILSATGLLKESLDVLSSLDISDLPNSIKIAYYWQMVYLYSHFGQYAAGTGQLYDIYVVKERLYTDSIHGIITKDDPQFLWLDTWYRINNEQYDELLDELESKVVLSSRSLAMSGIADIRTSNKDVASLQELAEYLIDEGEIIRAYNYISVCLQLTQKYHNRVRAVSISRVYDRILQSFLQRDKEQQEVLKKTNYDMIGVLVMLLVAVIIIVNIALRLCKSRIRLHDVNKELKRRRSELAYANQNLKEANENLVEVNAQMKQTNIQLKESNLAKEEYVAYVFAICSNYISKLEEYRKDINRKAKAKMLGEILTMTDKQTMVQEELKEFYHHFDAIFLRLYPTFLDDFNALLEPEERIVPRKGELLNTDLRIYALIRLGITDSVKISEFLHCSPQTIYNSRLKMRNKSKLSNEELVEVLSKIGRAAE